MIFRETSTQKAIYSEKKTPCTLAYKCGHSDEIDASIFKEYFNLK
jgi:hypothetical protein